MATDRERALALAKARQDQEAEMGGVAGTTWWQRFKKEGSDLSAGLLHAAQRPLDVPAAMVDTMAGGVEAGTRYMAPELAKKIDEFNNWLANASGNTIVEPGPVGENSTQAQVATKVAGDMRQSFLHPVDSFSERPIGTVLDWSSLIGAGVGKVPGLVRKPGKLKSADEILNISKANKERAFETAYAYPEEINVAASRDAALRAANAHGFNPDRSRYAPNIKPVDEITGYPNTGSVRDVHDMRMAADNLGVDATGKPILASDNKIAGAMKEAIDSGLEQSNPEAFALLKKAFDMNTKWRNTQAILDVEAAGRRAGSVSPKAASAVGREVNKTLGDDMAVRGLGDESAKDMTKITDMIKPASLPESIYGHAVNSLPTAMGALGFATPMGPAGALAGFATGGLIKHLLNSAKDAKTARKMSEELIALAQKINGIPRGKGGFGPGMMPVTPAGAIGTGATLGIIPQLDRR